jgi:acetolactate decarboxylase
MRITETKSWCVEWFGSQGDFIAGRAKEPVPLERFAGLEHLYAVGPLEKARGEISIFDSVPLIAEVQKDQVEVTLDLCRRAGFLVYAIVEHWQHVALREAVQDERQFEQHLLPLAVGSGIDVDQPFPFVINGRIAEATFHVLRNQSEGPYNPELHEKAKVRFSIADEPAEIVGFHSRDHRGIFTPGNSDFHLHIRTLDNRLSGHLETFKLPEGAMVRLPVNEETRG